ncbi:MAG TPA: zinc finger Ran-binding domain-containing protein [Verrucomicrobiae bacterium]|nr:zinc finger Ran-binding domain-containing protein [Verrucomicrobiae bacterium]
MSYTDVVMLCLFVGAFVIVPAIFVQMGLRRRHATHPSFQECPTCGADNYPGRERCYCCGYDLIHGRLAAPGEAVIERVKQADASRPKPQAPAQTRRIVED